MNYRHIYHAGNFADVFKHIVLMLCLGHLRQKDKPFFLLDTHAGIGAYDLQSEQARRTEEADRGIAQIMGGEAAPRTVQAYTDLIARFNGGEGLRTYPGSPLIMQAMLRDGDRMIANELHPDDAETLRIELARDARVRLERMDGYQALKAFLPPPERRGLVLVDPSFEVRNEFDLMAQGLRQAHARFATGIYALWYPIKNGASVKAFHDECASLDIPDIRALEFTLRPAPDEEALYGCGMLMVNAPWTLAREMEDVMPFLIERLTGGLGRFVVTEIRGEV